MKIVTLGFCGQPAALHLSAAGRDVVVVDNLARTPATSVWNGWRPGVLALRTRAEPVPSRASPGV